MLLPVSDCRSNRTIPVRHKIIITCLIVCWFLTCQQPHPHPLQVSSTRPLKMCCSIWYQCQCHPQANAKLSDFCLLNLKTVLSRLYKKVDIKNWSRSTESFLCALQTSIVTSSQTVTSVVPFSDSTLRTHP